MKGFGEIPNREGLDILSPSKLLDLHKSPWDYYVKNVLRYRKDTPSMIKGNLIHMAVLEPEKFLDTYEFSGKPVNDFSLDELKQKCIDLGLVQYGTKVQIAERIRTKIPDFKIWEDIQKESKKTLLPESTWQVCDLIQRQIKTRNVSSKLLPLAEKEVSGYWQHPSGIVLNFRLDFFGTYKGKGFVGDIKTSQRVDSWYVKRYNRESGRHIQMACYVDALQAITGVNFEDSAYYLFIKNDFPCSVVEHRCTYGMLETGRSEINSLIELYLKCKKDDYWPNEQPEMEDTDLSDYDYERVRQDEFNQ